MGPSNLGSTQIYRRKWLRLDLDIVNLEDTTEALQKPFDNPVHPFTRPSLGLLVISIVQQLTSTTGSEPAPNHE